MTTSFHRATTRQREAVKLDWKQTDYGILAVPLRATTEQIEEAFKRLAILVHPDSVEEKMRKVHVKCAFGKSQKNCEICARTVMFSKLTMAKATLLNSQLRAKYDMQLGIAGFRLCTTCKGTGQAQKKGTGGFRAARHVQMVPCAPCNTTGAVKQ